MLLRSWHIYEDYTGPLGAGTLTEITGPHFGPGIESSEGNGWGQWHRADRDGIGMDRTLASGTGFLGQYSSTVQALYEPLARCPDELLLFMHHVSYRYVLHSGKSVIQHIYDAHYEGAREAAALVQQWKQLSGRIDAPRYEEVLQRLQYQAGHALVWRDAICEWFLRISGIPDKYARVGNHPHRIEAESMDLDGYATEAVTPWETASGGRAVVCGRQNGCSASAVYKGKPGSYDIAVQYFDQNNGTARFRLLVNDRALEVWLADDHLPSAQRNGHSSARRLIPNVALKPGDVIRVEGQPDQGEPAPLDYLEIVPRPQ
jgi:alpha-glucuronidase